MHEERTDLFLCLYVKGGRLKLTLQSAGGDKVAASVVPPPPSAAVVEGGNVGVADGIKVGIILPASSSEKFVIAVEVGIGNVAAVLFGTAEVVVASNRTVGATVVGTRVGKTVSGALLCCTADEDKGATPCARRTKKEKVRSASMATMPPFLLVPLLAFALGQQRGETMRDCGLSITRLWSRRIFPEKSLERMRRIDIPSQWRVLCDYGCVFAAQSPLLDRRE